MKEILVKVKSAEEVEALNEDVGIIIPADISPFETAKILQECEGVDIVSGVSYWAHIPYFETEDGKIIDIVGREIEGG